MMQRNKLFHLLVAALVSWVVISCASMGSPDGGPYDEDPPKVLYSTPANGAVNADKKKISIWFDEYIKLENASEKVIVSPPQEEMPNVRADGKRIRIDLYDDLKPNTTYTVDFSDAIQDNNEGNPMGLYTYSFCTGPTIDTMEVSGTVLNAQDLEPVKGLLVGLYPADSISDTIFRTRPLLRVGRTNGSGKFTIKGVADGRYCAFALKDMDNDFRFSQKSEQIAFDTVSFKTYSKGDWRVDTTWVDTTHINSHIQSFTMQPYTHFYPDNITLLAFLEEGQDRHFLKTQYDTPEKFTFFFTAPHDSLPIIEGLNFDAEKTLYVEPSLHGDTITYWVTDTTVSYQDTLRFHVTYFETDSLGQLVLHTDSLQEIVPKQTHARMEKERLKKVEEWEKERQKKVRKAKSPLPDEKNPYEITYMDVSVKPTGSIDPNQNVSFVFTEPIADVDTTRLHFYRKIDSTLVEVPYLFLPDEDNPRRFTLYAEWEPRGAYHFEADSLTFTSILQRNARSIKLDFRVRATEEFGTIYVHLVNLKLPEGQTAYVELLDKSDKALAKAAVENNRADFFYLKPGEYYLRCFVDRNDNGIWDTGNYDQQLQPEEVYYFPKPLPVRALFDVKQDWDITGRPRTEQKPKEIIKQKPDKEKKRSTHERNLQRAEEMKRGKTKSRN